MLRFISIVLVALLLLPLGLISAQQRRVPGRERGGSRITRPYKEPRREEPKIRQSRPGSSPKGERWVRDPQNSTLQGNRFSGTRPQRRDSQTKEECRRIFSTVQQGLSTGRIGAFSGQMAPQVYMNLRGGESGYYSASQAHYVLEGYFKSRKLVNINFSTIGESDARPYATGSAVFIQRGIREIAQVYVLLGRSGDRWIITQINIY
jgi:hypothetical protein